MAWTDPEERAYHRSMAKLTGERGYVNLAQAHALAAADCPARCPCKGCEATRAEAMEARKAREAKRSRAAA